MDLPIDTNTLASSTSLTSFPPYYLRGYKVIGEEIAALLNRELADPLLFDENIIKIRQQRSALEFTIQNDRTIQLIENLPFNNNDFQPVEADFESISFERIDRPSLAFIMSALFGGFIGSILVLIQSAMRTRKKLD